MPSHKPRESSVCILAALFVSALSKASFAYEESELAFRGLQIWPGSETAGQMQIKSLSVRALLRDGIAETTLTTVFKNDVAEQCQASLDLGVPRGGVVVGYAYWFKGQRIDAHLLDNDRAWEIYRAITSHGRDPAIMEQWGNQRYHLQIYPVEPKKDLRVEVRYIAPLEGDVHCWFYQAPVAHGGTMPELDSFDGEVRVEDFPVSIVTENLGLESGRGEDSRTVTYQVQKENWKPREDWVISIRKVRDLEGREVPLWADSSGGPSGGCDGFFAVVLSTNSPVRNARVQLSGIKTWNVFPKCVSIPKAGGTALIAGRYAGRGTLGVRLGRSRSLQTRAYLDNVPVPNSPATKFYAASRIKELCGRVEPWRADASRKRVRRLVVWTSLRFGVVSPFTAWLAVPKSEMEFYLKWKAEHKTQTNAQRVQGGDPYIDVDAPADTVRVVALFPDGRVMELERDGATGHYRAQFDIPYLTPEGDYVVTIVIVSQDGRRRQVRLVYHVDRVAPVGQASCLCAEPGASVEVALRTDPDVSRVEMLTPWNERRSLRFDGNQWLSTLALPGQASVGSHPVRFVLTDQAHNQTTVTVELMVCGPEHNVGTETGPLR